MFWRLRSTAAQLDAENNYLKEKDYDIKYFENSTLHQDVELSFPNSFTESEALEMKCYSFTQQNEINEINRQKEGKNSNFLRNFNCSTNLIEKFPICACSIEHSTSQSSRSLLGCSPSTSHCNHIVPLSGCVNIIDLNSKEQLKEEYVLRNDQLQIISIHINDGIIS